MAAGQIRERKKLIGAERRKKGIRSEESIFLSKKKRSKQTRKM